MNPFIAGTDDHTAFLERFYRVQRHFYDLTRRLFLFGRERALARVTRQRPGSVLEIGCGTARNLARLRRRLPGADLCGVDACSQMLKSARRRPGLRLYHRRAEDIASPAELGRPGGFDAVLLSYALSMMPQWRPALQAARRCLAPGGALHVVDFWDFARWPGPLRGLIRRHLAAHHVRHEPGVLDWLRQAGAAVSPVAGRWAYVACLQAGR
ncbi:MAG: class I SAM-dependent methyltransferase [Planctomycetes bacterium]|jgi:S-adenosylmethionine-diacylgycerolhomoserine-N-methlytransferase|nr:class I SAM-dependent methyltransferase [Planctomycetota bacterium]MCL4729996.1 methyltransferase domain-containing protein [Planctomycetota bacterium]